MCFLDSASVLDDGISAFLGTVIDSMLSTVNASSIVATWFFSPPKRTRQLNAGDQRDVHTSVDLSMYCMRFSTCYI